MYSHFCVNGFGVQKSEDPILSYREELREFRDEVIKHRKLVGLIIKITVVVLAAAFLLTTFLFIADMVGDSKSPDNNSGESGGRDRTPPVIKLREGDAIYMYVGENALLKSAVTVIDDSGYTLDVEQNGLNKDKPGTYTIRYIAKDTAGNTSTLDVKVIVTKQEYAYSALMSLVAKKAEQLGITDKMTKQQQVFAIYKYVNSPDKSAPNANIVFVDESNIPAIDRNNWETDWVEEAARTLQSGEGDCYSYYAVSKAFFEYFGIENKGIRRDDARSEMSGTHFWSMVNIGSTDNPRWYFYDGTRLAGKFPDDSKDGCLRTYEELMAYVPNNGQNGFYVFDASAFPKTETAKIAR